MTENSARPAQSAAPETDEQYVPGDLDDSIGFILSDTTRYVKRTLYAQIAQHGIRGGYWFFLRSLWQEEGCSQRELADRLGLVEPSVLEMIRSMEKDGLVRRERDPNDGRKRLVFLTDRARDMQPELMKIATDSNSRILSTLSTAEQVVLKQCLKRIRDVLAADFARMSAQTGDSVKAATISDEQNSDRNLV